METRKVYVIASTEYEANMPDLFLMDEEGNYYGVSQDSYAVWHKYPKSIDFWRAASGSDAGRRFNIDLVEIPQDKVDEFDRLTKEYDYLDQKTPRFEQEYPVLRDYKTKKEYNLAVSKFMDAHAIWAEESNVAHYIRKKSDVWTQRTELFITFSKNVYDAIKDNNCISHP